MDRQIYDPDCTRCPRLAAFLAEVREREPGYHALPVAPFGAAAPRVLIVGLAPGMHGANRTGRPFTGDFAGVLLYATLHRFGFASQPEGVAVDDGMRLIDCRITNAVKCLPPQNRPLASEINTCNDYLGAELKSLGHGAVVVALGTVAHRAVLRALGLRQALYRFAHGAEHHLESGRVLVDSYHCSRYNTNTRRLTESMFFEVFARVRALADNVSSPA